MKLLFLLTFIVSLPLFLGIPPAHAAVIDFSQTVDDGLGGKLKDGKEDATLGKIAARALFAVTPDEKLDEEEKFKRGVLGTKLAKGGEIDLTVEEIAMVKKAIGKAFPPNVVAATWPLLDPTSSPAAPDGGGQP